MLLVNLVHATHSGKELETFTKLGTCQAILGEEETHLFVDLFTCVYYVRYSSRRYMFVD